MARRELKSMMRRFWPQLAISFSTDSSCMARTVFYLTSNPFPFVLVFVVPTSKCRAFHNLFSWSTTGPLLLLCNATTLIKLICIFIPVHATSSVSCLYPNWASQIAVVKFSVKRRFYWKLIDDRVPAWPPCQTMSLAPPVVLKLCPYILENFTLLYSTSHPW